MAEYKPTSSEESSQEENIESNKVEKNLKKGAYWAVLVQLLSWR